MSDDPIRKTIKPITGRAWVFGDNVDTDQITPGKALTLPMKEARQYVLATLKPEFNSNVKMGDVIVAGRNFGCGSSREQSPEVLKDLGLGAIVAESFGRIFYRNAIAIGLPALIAPGIADKVKDGDEITVDINNARVTNESTDMEIPAKPLDPILHDILHAGNIIQKLREELKH